MREPKLREDVYVPTSLYLSHGKDDVVGGLAQVVEIRTGTKGKALDINLVFVRTLEHPNVFYNWAILLEKQEELKEEFGNQRAYPDPDMRAEFNDWW